MNPYSGDIERFVSPAKVPAGWLELTPAEAEEFSRLPLDLRLEKYMKNHFSQSCRKCNKFVGNHSLKKFKECAAGALAEIDIARHEEMAFDSLPLRDPQEELRNLRERFMTTQREMISK